MTMLPTRFADREEIAAVRAKAEQLAPDEEGAEKHRHVAQRPMAQAPELVPLAHAQRHHHEHTA